MREDGVPWRDGVRGVGDDRDIEKEETAGELCSDRPTASCNNAFLHASSSGSSDEIPGLFGGGKHSAKSAAPTESWTPSPCNAEACTANG